MHELEDIQILYAFHFDSPPKERARGTNTVLITLFGILETSK
jgi:hypothetical protein